jgi:hypothetical protein
VLENTGIITLDIIVLCWLSFLSFKFCLSLIHTGPHSTCNTLSTVASFSHVHFFTMGNPLCALFVHWLWITHHSADTDSKLNCQSILLTQSLGTVRSLHYQLVLQLTLYKSSSCVSNFLHGARVYALSPVPPTSFRIIQLHSGSIAKFARRTQEGDTLHVNITG